LAEEGLHGAWKRLQSEDTPDLVWTPYNGGHWIAVRGSLVREGYSDPTRFSSQCIWIPREAGLDYEFIPIIMDPPEHTPWRQILNKVLGLKHISAFDDLIEQQAVELIDNIKDRGHCDFARDYAEIFPVRIFMILLGLPLEDGPYLKSIVDHITRPDGTVSMRDASNMLFEYLDPVIDDRWANPGEDFISVLINSEVEGRKITKPEAQRLIGLILIGGLDTVINFLGFVMMFLAENPEYRRELANNPQRIRTVVEELGRRFPIVAIARTVKKDIELDGVTLRQGEMILLPTMLDTLDDREYECPMKVDFDRRRKPNSFFGGGPHVCAGMHLARKEIIVTLQEWLKRIPEFELSDDVAPRYQSSIVSTIKGVRLAWAVESVR
jgi:cytochrome P450